MRQYELYEIQLMTCHIMAKMEANTICVFEWDMFVSALDRVQESFHLYSVAEQISINEILEEFDKNLTRFEMRIDLHQKMNLPCNLN